jgi:hypothetical protein
LKLLTTHHSVLTLHLLLFICLDPWRRIWDVAVLQMTTKWRKRCNTGSELNQNNYFMV